MNRDTVKIKLCNIFQSIKAVCHKRDPPSKPSSISPQLVVYLEDVDGLMVTKVVGE
jgi:hypothetical protein